MRKFLALAVCGFLAACAQADVALLLEQYLWEKRVLMVLAPSASHPDYLAQRVQLDANLRGMHERDVVVYEIIHQETVRVDGRYVAQLATSPFYAHFDVKPDAFWVILLGKDGEEKLRQRQALLTESLFERIDAMPMRQQEMRQTP